MSISSRHTLAAAGRARSQPGAVPELCDGCVLLPGDGTAFGATGLLFKVPLVGPARLGDVADGVPPLRDGPVVPLETEPPPELKVPPLVCAKVGAEASSATNEMPTTAGTGERIIYLLMVWRRTQPYLLCSGSASGNAGTIADRRAP